ncbi:hypothetical protein [Marinobacterium aestuariivivens]|uniref:Uncharacterized protein n=1 Tax=Marinobacterium aestuariivivens TaxID=1698799 RepID=A0ABW2A604_9GAMM
MKQRKFDKVHNDTALLRHSIRAAAAPRRYSVFTAFPKPNIRATMRCPTKSIRYGQETSPARVRLQADPRLDPVREPDGPPDWRQAYDEISLGSKAGRAFSRPTWIWRRKERREFNAEVRRLPMQPEGILGIPKTAEEYIDALDNAGLSIFASILREDKELI